MKWLRLLTILALPLAAQAVPHNYYASTSGSGSSCSDLPIVNNAPVGTPCKLSDLLDTTVPVSAGSTIYILDGTYSGKFTASLSGTNGNSITVRPFTLAYPPAVIIDGNATTTLSVAITTTGQTTLSLTDGTNFPANCTITIADQSDPGSDEQLSLVNKSGNNYTNVQRGWNGTTAQTHSNGATVVLGGNQITTSGSYLIFQGIRFTNSYSTRIQTPANAQNAPFLRGEGVFNTGDFNQFINCVIDNNQDGFFNSQLASGTVIYGSVIFNNGYVAGGAYNGHGLYFIHEDAVNTAYIKENIIFNNSSIGVKGDSQNSDCKNIWSEGNIAFNSGSWAQGTSRNRNFLMSSNNGIADAITVKDNIFAHTNGINGQNAALGLGESNLVLSVTGNVSVYGIPWAVSRWSTITFTGNTTYGDDNTGGGNNTMVLYDNAASSPTVTWNLNIYNNQIALAKGYYPTGASSSSTFAQWKVATGFDAGSTESTSTPSDVAFVRTNAYDSSLVHVTVLNFSGASSMSVNLGSAITAGQTYTVYAVENPFVSIASGTYTSGNITFAMNGTTVLSQIGADESVIKTPATMRPTFESFIVVVQSVTSGSVISGSNKISGSVFH